MLTLPWGVLTLNIMLMQHHDSPEGALQGGVCVKTSILKAL